MKHSKSKVVLLLALLSTATMLYGRPQLRNLDIQVVLAHNGDAYITETRTMDIDSEGTECYIVIGNLNGSEVRDLKVSDETGRTTLISATGILMKVAVTRLARVAASIRRS